MTNCIFFFISRYFILIIIFALTHSIAWTRTLIKVDSTLNLYNEHFRPQFHFSPASNWSNDPNGLVYHDGEYHLFYQHYPYGMEWGPMHWGHAKSRDLIHWETLPIALYPDSMGYIFSGSVVIDYDNTAGFQNSDEKPMVAIFTYFEPKTKLQTQAIAFSNDKGHSWTKYEGNPIIKNPGISDFRDPKVRWHEPTKKWVMILACGDHVKFYTSSDLKKWEEQGVFGKELELIGGDWDCPDLFPLRVSGEVEEKWVITISSSGAPDGGRGTHYYIGNFDGKNFIPDDIETRWLENGLDQYAGITFNGTSSRTVFMGWIENWPTEISCASDYTWRGAMTLPMELEIDVNQEGKFFVKKKPIAELKKSEHLIFCTKKKELQQNTNWTKTFDEEKLSSSVIRLKVGLQDTSNLHVILKNDLNEKIQIVYDRKGSRFIVDKSFANMKCVDYDSPKINSFNAPNDLTLIELDIFYDRSVVEIFFGNGRWMTTDLVFPTTYFNRLDIQADGHSGEIQSLNIATLKSVWQQDFHRKSGISK